MATKKAPAKAQAKAEAPPEPDVPEQETPEPEPVEDRTVVIPGGVLYFDGDAIMGSASERPTTIRLTYTSGEGNRALNVHVGNQPLLVTVELGKKTVTVDGTPIPLPETGGAYAVTVVTTTGLQDVRIPVSVVEV